MSKTVTLQDEELKLVVELLERERGDLPAEIHHTMTTEFKDGLTDRLEIVDRLLARLDS